MTRFGGRTMAILAIVVAFGLSAASETNAGGRGGRWFGRPIVSPSARVYSTAGAPLTFSLGNYGFGATPGAISRAPYPKYYGEFHSRHLQNIGIPTGDIGIRGNGLYGTPW
ncbi:MAG: hypothetical protein KDA62_11250 [Planctomycetales bacterium]|nr:hypothetical protein [Planctomycetales bacterium]